MKKTPFILALVFAVSATALQAADTPLTLPTTQLYVGNTNVHTLSSGNQGIYWDTTKVDASLSSYMFTFSSAPTADQTNCLFTMDVGSYSTPIGLGVQIHYTNNSTADDTLYISNAKTDLSTTGLAFTSGQSYTFAYNGTTNTAYIVGGTDAQGTTQYISYTVTDTSLLTTLQSAELRGFANGNPGKTPVTFGNVTDLTTIAGDATTFATTIGIPAPTAPIPEPTTATLSLLALAGLAARRRRK